MLAIKFLSRFLLETPIFTPARSVPKSFVAEFVRLTYIKDWKTSPIPAGLLPRRYFRQSCKSFICNTYKMARKCSF